MFKKNIHEKPLEPELFNMARLTIKVRKLHKKTPNKRKRKSRTDSYSNRTGSDEKTRSRKKTVSKCTVKTTSVKGSPETQACSSCPRYVSESDEDNSVLNSHKRRKKRRIIRFQY